MTTPPTTVPFELPPTFESKVAVITGASRGLGAGLADRLAERGFALGLCARSVPSAPGHAVTDRLVRSAVDVSDAAAVERFAHDVAHQLGPIDLWVNNAGVLGPVAPARSSDPAQISEALLINIGGVIAGSAAFARLSRGWGTGRRVLVNISSGASTSIYQGWSTYGATKAAVDQFTRILAAEEPELVVHSMAPGVVDTDMQAMIRASDIEDFPALERFVELSRTGSWNSPAWIADHLAGLVSATFVPHDVVFRVPSPGA